MLNVFENLYDFMNQLTNYYYQGVQGVPLPNNSPIYVYRKADPELYQFLSSPQTLYHACYILASPQMGKTSLMVRTAKKFINEGEICILSELKITEKNRYGELLYFHLLKIISENNHIFNNHSIPELDKFWVNQKGLTPASKFEEFIKIILNVLTHKKLIIFIDNVHILTTYKLEDSFLKIIETISKSKEEYTERLYFVFSGVSKPSDLLDNRSSFNFQVKLIELNHLQGECQPLLMGLNKVSQNPREVLEIILSFTGGQPFLTQILCSLVAKNNKIKDNLDTKYKIQEIINTYIIKIEDRSKPICLHISKIEDYFIRGDPEKSADKILALNLYKRILRRTKYYKFAQRSSRQMDLLMAGLVVEFESFITIANPIYKQIFSQKWVEETKKKINNREVIMADKLVYKRDVFVLIDRSGTMRLPDSNLGNKKRWEFLKETVYSHVDEIFEEADETYGKICDEITLYFFNAPNIRPNKTITLRDAEDVFLAFEENKPTGSTFIELTLDTAIERWFSNRTQDRGAFIIIYIDGEMDDKDKFLNLIAKTCKRINSQNDIKILMIGLGSDIEKEAVIDFYVGIDVNTNQFNSNKGEPCNIFVFDLIQHVMEEGIVHALERQLIPNPEQGLAYWIERDYPNVYKKYI